MDERTLDWRKASYSNGSGNCVEVGRGASRVLVRDTRTHEGVALSVSRDAWASFTASLK